jgi:hypothetical protein
VRIPLPYGGQHSGSERGDQPPGTSAALSNYLPFDARTGRRAIAQRPGHSKYSSTVIGGSKVKAIAPVPADVELRTYSSLGNSVTTEWSATTPTLGDSKGVKVDRQGNAYFIDGKAAIVKVNPAGAIVAKLSLPIADPLHEIRALHVDRFDRLYVGVSAGGAQSKARIWCYAQDDDDTFRLVWQMEPGEYIEAIVTSNDALYYAGNKTDSNTARIVGFSGFDVDSPTERFVRAAPYPINDLAISPKDGALYLAAEPNATRGYNPLSPDTTAVSEDWTAKNNLESWQRRAWSLYDTRVTEGMLIIPPTGTEDIEGGTCSILYDLSGNNRHFYQDATGAGTHTGPRYRSRSVGGLPGLHFNGSTNSMITLAPTSNDKASRAEQLTAVPCYAGAQFVWVMVCRLAVSSTGHYVFAQDSGAGGARAIVANAHPGAAIAGTASDNSVRLFETGGVASTAAASSTAATAPAGSGTTPLAGAIGPGGLCVLTWVCDGGVQDVFGSATRSVWRVNGMPCDRWQSAAFTATVGTKLGFSSVGALSAMAGDFLYGICIADWYDVNDARQRLVLDNNSTQPLDTRYPDLAFSFSSTVTNDIEELEGQAAHAFGIAHVLPAGQAAWLRDNAGGAVAAADTVTIGGTVYTFRAAAGAFAGANDVLIGGSVEISLRNLRRAMNGEGSPGVDYDSATQPHPDFRAFGPIAYQNTNRCALGIRSLNPSLAAALLAEASATLAWSAAASGAVLTADSFSTSAVSKNTNWYPHQYFPDKIANRTLGGPPRSEDALTAPSKPGLLISGKYGMVAKIDPANGKVKWIATSNWNNGGLGVGGVGYGVVISPDGDVYCCGPRQVLVTTPSIAADAIDVRKIIDTGSDFSLTAGTTATTAWQDDPGALTYEWPRMAVDKYDNLYVPIFQSAAGTSLIVYARLGVTPVGSDNANEIATVTTITDDPRAYAVAVHPTIPDYPASFTSTRAQFVYLATEKTASNVAEYKLGLVSVVNATGSPRSVTRLAVVGADIKTFTSSGTVTTVGNAVLDSAAQLVSAAVGYRKVFFFDGRKPYYFDAVLGTVSAFTAQGGGEVPLDARHATFWRGRLFVASGSKWAASEVGNPFGWNFFPAVPNDGMAVSNTTALAGQPPDPIQSLHAINDDLILIGGMGSIRAMAGDPARPNTKIQLVTDKVGTSFGPCWARDDAGISYFFGSDANVYAYSGGQIQALTLGDSNIHEALRAIDFSAYYAQLIFDTRWQVLHVLILPFGAGGVTVTTHYRWHKPTKGWWPVQYAAAGTQYTCAAALEADTVADRVILFGHEDGYVRREDPAAKTDDGLRIATSCLIGPIAGEDSEYEIGSTEMLVSLDGAADGALFQLYSAAEPTLPASPDLTGQLHSGYNSMPARMCNSFIWLKFLSLSVTPGTRHAIESAHLDLSKAGRKYNAPVR